MDFDKKVISKLDEMNRYVREIEDLIPDVDREYQQDLKTKRASEKTIELAIECVISIISSIVSYKKLGVPQDEDNLIDILEKEKIISSELAQTVREMKGFRNILVHKYGTVDDHKAFTFLAEQLDDFTTFENEIKSFLRNNL